MSRMFGQSRANRAVRVLESTCFRWRDDCASNIRSSWICRSPEIQIRPAVSEDSRYRLLRHSMNFAADHRFDHMLVGRPPPLRARKRALLSGNTESIGQASDVEIHAKEMLESRDRLNGILAKHTGQGVERLSKTLIATVSWMGLRRFGMA
jgi:ClpP protease-like protein